MDFSGIIPALEQVAPTIATLFGGPLAGMGVQAIEKVFGLDPGTGATNAAALNAAIAGMTPEQAIELAKEDAELKGKLIDAGISYEKIAADDRNSARLREGSVKDWTPRVLAFCLIGGFLGMGWGVLFGTLHADTALAGTVIGYLSAKAEQVVAYYFGSSAGSEAKNRTISDLTSVPTKS